MLLPRNGVGALQAVGPVDLLAEKPRENIEGDGTTCLAGYPLLRLWTEGGWVWTGTGGAGGIEPAGFTAVVGCILCGSVGCRTTGFAAVSDAGIVGLGSPPQVEACFFS